MTQSEIDNEFDVKRLHRKLNQAWEMAGLARQDGDRADEKRRTEEVRAIEKRIKDLSEM